MSAWGADMTTTTNTPDALASLTTAELTSAGSVSISDVTVAEGNSGTKVANFKVTRVGGAAAFTLGFATENGTASSMTDYDAATGTIEFAIGQFEQTIAVNIHGDTLVEDNETFFVNLGAPTNGVAIAKGRGLGTILNDDTAAAPGSVSISDVSITEGNNGAKLATFTVTRSGGTAAFAVNYATANGTATAGSDYAANTGALSFAAGVNSQTIAVSVNGDTLVESDETFFVNLSAPTNGAVIDKARGVGTIVNDDIAVIFTEGADNVRLTTPNQTWHALGGDDRVIGSKGRDNIFGDAGNDFLSGGDELELTADQKALYRLYGATLAREPDAAGLDGWAKELGKGATLASVAAGFVASREFQAAYGALGNDAFVALLYKNVLNRAADAGGLAGWTAQLAARTTRESVVLGFSESAEYQGNMDAGTRGFATAVQNSAAYGQLFRMYAATLNRAPDVAGFEAWVDTLAGGQALASVAAGFVASSEFQSVYGALSDTQFVTLLYNNVLHRGADAAGLAHWTAELASGKTRESIVLGLSESVEHINGSDAAMQDFMRKGMGDWADTLNGGAGDDTLVGGRGADTYQFDAGAVGSDHIYGFESWDILNLTGFGYSNAAAAAGHMRQSGADVVFADQGETITFHNTALAVVSGAAFTFT